MKRLLLIASLVLGVSSAKAIDFDFFGNFTADDDVAVFNFTVAADSTVTVFSSSWDDGGFDPVLALWDAAGNLIVEQDDGLNAGSTLSNLVSYDHGEWDSHYSQLLTTGSYTVTIAQYDNFAVGSTLTQGFTYDGDPMFTQAFGSAPMFNGVEGELNQDTGLFEDPRTGDFVFHILNVAEARQGVPDSGLTLVLLGLTVAVLGMFRARPEHG